MNKSQRGSASVVTLVLILLTAFVFHLCLLLGAGITAQARAQAVADLSALAAADHLRWHTPIGAVPTTSQQDSACMVAQAVASANTAELSKCEVGWDGPQYWVQVTVQVPDSKIRPWVLATARAGPQY